MVGRRDDPDSAAAALASAEDDGGGGVAVATLDAWVAEYLVDAGLAKVSVCVCGRRRQGRE